MTDNSLTLNSDLLRESLHEWQIEQESLEAEWNESLSALAAYQSHLDAWQHDLAEERDAVRNDREALTEERDTLLNDRQEFARERAAAELNHDKTSAQTIAQLAESREKVALLSEQLLKRTEELRLLDQRRAELATKLEVSRATGKQLAADAEQQRKSLDVERSAWTEQLQHLRELLEQRTLAPVTGYDDEENGPALESAPPVPRPAKTIAGSEKPSANNPVLGSIMEQFGKLRQQRATDRQTGKNSR